MLEIAARQAILHALVASAVVAVTLRAWGIRRAQSRLRFWLLALGFPFLVLPVFLLVAPFRSADRFAAGWALFSSDRWNDVHVLGAGVATITFALLMAAGTLLFLRDAVPFLGAAVVESGKQLHGTASPPRQMYPAQFPGAVVVLETEASIVFVHGLVRHTLVLSEGALAQLSPDRLQAAIAHETAHARFHDPLAGWILMGARLVMFWNPAVQLMARAVVHEMEHRADAVAAQATSAEAVAAALETLWGRPCERGAKSIAPLFERWHEAHITGRIEALHERIAGPGVTGTHLAVVGATLAVLLFFVV